MSNLEKVLLLVNFILYGFLAVFSYAYVDLNLTFSQNKVVLDLIGTLQQLGYYNRPQATFIYLIFIIFAFSFFGLNLYLFKKSKVALKYLKLSTLINTAILIFAYPFLSSDLFNYLFDAKIILKYHASPYTHKPLDFGQDEWLRFMRWTHRYSPYGPLWLLMSAIPATLGFGKFLLNFLAFKVFIGAFHLFNSYLIHKTLKKITPKLADFGTAFYAANPLFLIEGVANAHNDVVLAAFLITPIYFILAGRNIFSYIFLFLGTAIKYIPVLNLPWLLVFKGEKLVWANLITMTLFTYLFSSFRITTPFVSAGATQVQFQPWYLFWTIPLVSLIPRTWLIITAIALSFGASLRYLPYLFYGDWSQPQTTEFMTLILAAPAALALLFILSKLKLK